MKKFLLIPILLPLIFFKTAYSKELEAFCLITTADIKDARLDPKENERFAGKTIKLFLAFAENNTEENSESQNQFLKLVKDITSKGFVRSDYKRKLVDLSDIRINLKGKK